MNNRNDHRTDLADRQSEDITLQSCSSSTNPSRSAQGAQTVTVHTVSKPLPTTRIIHNPYAQRKAPPEIFQHPLVPPQEDPPSEEEQQPPYPRSETDEATSSENNFITAVNHPPPSNGEAARTSVVASGDASEQAQPVVVATTRSVDLPPWERLPSRNLTFGSAELLSITECYRYRQLYDRRSVRTLGVLAQKLVLNDASVSLVLKDPLTYRPKNAGVAQGQQQRGGDSSPRRDMAATTPAPRSNGVARSPTPVVKSIIRAQPLKSRIATSTTTTILSTSTPIYGTTTSASATPGFSVSRKRPLSSLSSSRNVLPRDPVQTLVTEIASNTGDALWVVVSPNEGMVTSLIVGDLVTVIGELHYHRDSTVDLTATGLIPESVRQVAGTLSNSNQQPYSYVHARILQNSNGTNVTLFLNALQVRRNLLRSIAQAQRLNSGCSEPPSGVPIQGCGPPE